MTSTQNQRMEIGLKDLDKMQEEIKKEMPVEVKEISKNTV